MGLISATRIPSVLDAVQSIAMSGRHSDGAFLFRLEKQLSAMTRGQAAVAFHSLGSAAYTAFLIYARRGVKAVAIQNNSNAIVAAMALQAGLHVCLVDSGPYCPAMSKDTLLETLKENKQIGLVVLSHVGGFLAKDYAEIADICMDKELPLMEDCSSVLGIKKEFAGPGSLAQATLWSFDTGSIVPVGAGAALATSDLELRDEAKSFRCGGRYVHNGNIRFKGGLDLKMTEWNAAVACVMLEGLPDVLVARRRDADALQSIAPCILSHINSGTNWERYPVAPEFVLTSKNLAPSMYALPDQVAYSLDTKNMSWIGLQNSARWANNHRCLPIGDGLYDGMDQKQIMEYVRTAY